MIQGKLLSNGSDLTQALEIRRKVFIEELHKNEQEEFDEQDTIGIHVIVYEQEEGRKPVATGRILFDGNDCEIGHIAVLKEYRNREYGDFTVRMLINKAFTSGIQEVGALVPIHLKEFFIRIGFKEKINTANSEKVEECFMVITDGDVLTSCKRK